MNGIVAALGGADRIGAAGIAGLGRQRVVAALAVGAADRMDRRQIEHVEAERRDLGQPTDAIVERAVAAGNAALAARHHFVPGARACDRSVGDQRIERAAGEVGADRPCCGSSKLGRQQRICVAPLRNASWIRRASARHCRCRSLARSRRPSSISRHTSMPGLSLGQNIAPPGREHVGPGFDGIEVAAGASA